MSIESPNLRDGVLVAAANYSNTAALAGQGGSGQFLGVALSGAADLTALLVSATGQQGYGILQNKPIAAAAADVVFFGVTKAMAGGSITRGAALMFSSNGTIVAWTAGSGYAQIGYARESAVINQIFSMFFGATSPKVLT